MFTLASGCRSSSTTRRGEQGWSLIEMMVTALIGTAVLAAVSVTCSFANRTLDAIGNYADLDRQSSNALNLMARDVRQTVVSPISLPRLFGSRTCRMGSC